MYVIDGWLVVVPLVFPSICSLLNGYFSKSVIL